MNHYCPFCHRETPRQTTAAQMCTHCGRRWRRQDTSPGETTLNERAEARRQMLTLSSPCPSCGRRCLAHLKSGAWRCYICKVEFTEDNLPPDRFVRTRAALARAKNIATVEEFHAHLAERMGLERVRIVE